MAEVIPFPRTAPQTHPLQPAAASPTAPAEAELQDARLAASLASLFTALEEQRAAIAAWRAHLGELKGAMGGLRHSMTSYRQQLDGLQGHVAELGRSAQALAGTTELASRL